MNHAADAMPPDSTKPNLKPIDIMGNHDHHHHHFAEMMCAHAVHLGMSVALVVLACETLKKVTKIHRALKEIRDGRRELIEELHAGHHKK